MFALDPAFFTTSAPLTRLALCDARLQLDARFAWLVLIPRVAGAREIEDLPEPARFLLMAEIVLAGRAARAIGEAAGRPVEKLNIGALGNITAHLHVHVTGRRADDPAWPGPVWGFGRPTAYSPNALAVATAAALAVLEA
ncbi:MAG: HIT family protein [Caulobacteraceae bacterium]|nr:HIT family protein [Caulobacteraceae bacterium]